MPILKPQNPPEIGGNQVFNLTSADQVVKQDGTRLEKSNGIDADTLGGKTENELSVLNSQQLGGVRASAYITKPEMAYSTEEKVIGTWIDGKPIYRKVLIIPKAQLSTGNQIFKHNITNLKAPIKVGGFVNLNNGAPAINWDNTSNYQNYSFYTSDFTSDTFRYYLGQNSYENLIDVQLVVEYIKTTD